MKQAINIIFDGPPTHESEKFVEVETDDGKSINAGEWVEREDGLWALRITELPKENTNTPNLCCLGVKHTCTLNVNDGYCLARTCQYQVQEIQK